MAHGLYGSLEVRESSTPGSPWVSADAGTFPSRGGTCSLSSSGCSWHRARAAEHLCEEHPERPSARLKWAVGLEVLPAHSLSSRFGQTNGSDEGGETREKDDDDDDSNDNDDDENDDDHYECNGNDDDSDDD